MCPLVGQNTCPFIRSCIRKFVSYSFDVFVWKTVFVCKRKGSFLVFFYNRTPQLHIFIL